MAATGHQLSALGLGAGNVSQAALVLRAVDQGAHGGVHVGGQARSVALREQAHQLVNEHIVQAVVDEQAAGRAAGLTAPGEVHAAHRAIHGAFEVGVGKDHHGVLAAQFQQRALEGVGRRLQHGPSRRHAADQAHGRHLGVAGQLRPHVAPTHHAVEHPGWEHVGQQFHQTQGRQRRLLGWLDHHRVAGGQRRRDFAGREHEGMVEGVNAGDHAQGLAPGVVQRAIASGDGLALDLQHQARKVLELGGGNLRIKQHGLDGVATVGGIEQRQIGGMGSNDRCGLTQTASALQRWHGRPAAKCRLRAGHGGVNLGRAGQIDLSQDLAGGRVDARQPLCIGTLMPAPAIKLASLNRQNGGDAGRQIAGLVR